MVLHDIFKAALRLVNSWSARLPRSMDDKTKPLRREAKPTATKKSKPLQKIVTLEDALRAYDNRSTSNIYVYLACGAIGFSYLIMAWNEYLARFKPDKLNIKMKSLLTKPLVEEGSIPFGFSSILFRQWLKESWWLADNIKKANLLIDLVLVMRNTSSYSLLLEVYLKAFMDKEIRQQAIDLQAPLFILANQRYDLPKQGLLETSDIKVLRALLEDEDDVERVVDSYYLDVLLDFACNPDNNWLKSCVLLHRIMSCPRAWKKLKESQRDRIKKRMAEIEARFERHADDILLIAKFSVPTLLPVGLSTSAIGAPIVATIAALLWSGGRWARLAMKTRLWYISKEHAATKIVSDTLRSMGLSVVGATLWDRVYHRRDIRAISETKSYTLAGAWYAGIFAYFYVGVRNVPFSVMPVLITLAALRPLKTPL